MGFGIKDLLLLSPSDVLLALREKQKYDIQLERTAWERARMIAFFTLKPNDSKNKLKRFSDIIEFTWEKEERSKVDPQAEIARIKEKYAKIEGK